MSDDPAFDANVEDVTERGEAIYDTRLKAEVESLYPNQFIAIHVDSGDYAISKKRTVATNELLTRHPIDGRIFSRKIGDELEWGLIHRLSPASPFHARNRNQFDADAPAKLADMFRFLVLCEAQSGEPA